VITGEGEINSQTSYGKVPFGVARVAKKYGIPVLALAGNLGAGSEELYKILDEELYFEYAKTARAIVEHYKGRYLASGGKATPLFGD
jgi:glycerate kinase